MIGALGVGRAYELTRARDLDKARNKLGARRFRAHKLSLGWHFSRAFNLNSGCRHAGARSLGRVLVASSRDRLGGRSRRLGLGLLERGLEREWGEERRELDDLVVVKVPLGDELCDGLDGLGRREVGLRAEAIAGSQPLLPLGLPPSRNLPAFGLEKGAASLPCDVAGLAGIQAAAEGIILSRKSDNVGCFVRVLNRVAHFELSSLGSLVVGGPYHVEHFGLDPVHLILQGFELDGVVGTLVQLELFGRAREELGAVALGELGQVEGMDGVAHGKGAGPFGEEVEIGAQAAAVALSAAEIAGRVHRASLINCG